MSLSNVDLFFYVLRFQWSLYFILMIIRGPVFMTYNHMTKNVLMIPIEFVFRPCMLTYLGNLVVILLIIPFVPTFCHINIAKKTIEIFLSIYTTAIEDPYNNK